MKTFFVLVIVAAFFLAGCNLPTSDWNTATPANAAVATLPAGDTGQVLDSNTTQTEADSKTLSAPQTTCILDSFPTSARFGVQIEVDKHKGTDWLFNPSITRRVKGDSAHPELKPDADLSGCPLIAEGRKQLTEEHHIWVLIPGDKQYLNADGKFHCVECSVWAYPISWNMENFSTAKAPIAGEFVDAKRNNMKANGYDWPIYVHLSSGSTLEFKSGVKVGAALPNNCSFKEPQRLNVTGVYDPVAKTFTASIGAEGCWSAVYIGGSAGGLWESWLGAKDNVVIPDPSHFEAWLMPDTYKSETEVLGWTVKHIIQ